MSISLWRTNVFRVHSLPSLLKAVAGVVDLAVEAPDGDAAGLVLLRSRGDGQGGIPTMRLSESPRRMEEIDLPALVARELDFGQVAIFYEIRASQDLDQIGARALAVNDKGIVVELDLKDIERDLPALTATPDKVLQLSGYAQRQPVAWLPVTDVSWTIQDRRLRVRFVAEAATVGRVARFYAERSASFELEPLPHDGWAVGCKAEGSILEDVLRLLGAPADLPAGQVHRRYHPALANLGEPGGEGDE